MDWEICIQNIKNKFESIYRELSKKPLTATQKKLMIGAGALSAVALVALPILAIGGLEASGGIKLMAEWILAVTKGSESATAMIILWASGIISGVIDNIPYTATMSPMIGEIQTLMGKDYAYPLWWCLSLGACLGGNMTIIGAAANVIVSENAAKSGHPITFMQFLKYGIPVVFISLIISTGYIYLRFLR